MSLEHMRDYWNLLSNRELPIHILIEGIKSDDYNSEYAGLETV